VRIHHAGGIVSVYGHLSGIVSGIDEGRSVRMGQLIGQVGSSGLSTGPHLHYGIEKDGRFVNPLDETLGEHHEVSPRLRALFDHLKGEYLAALDHLPLGGHYSVTLAGDHPAANNVSQIIPAESKLKPVRDRPGRRPMRAQPVVAETAIGGRVSVMR
jgi:hypothetical protein